MNGLKTKTISPAKSSKSFGDILHGIRTRRKTLKVVRLHKGFFKVIFRYYLPVFRFVVYQKTREFKALGDAYDFYAELRYHKFKF